MSLGTVVGRTGWAVRIGGLGFHSSSPFGYLRIRSSAGEAESTVLATRAENGDLLRLASLLQGLREAVVRSTGILDGPHGVSRLGRVRLGSDRDLGLTRVGTSAALRSSAEINTLPTSYSPFGPTFEGSSSSSPTLNGVYDGGQGDQTLTFRATLVGIVGTSPVRVDVFDESGTRVDRLNFGSDYTPETAVSLSNGLALSLSGGLVSLNDQFQVQVSTSVGSAVDPTKPFNGTRNQRPNFEPGFAVAAGAFKINGISIAVGASDSIGTVLARINASSAGVSASFDAATERILLQHRTPGAAGTILLEDDTSGFLAATKLDTAVLDPGSDPDLAHPIGVVSALAGITSGTLRINGNELTIDVATETLAEVLERIEALEPGLVARYDETQGRVLLGGVRMLELDDGGTGFFATLGIEAGAYRARKSSSRGFSQPHAVQKELVALARSFNDLFAAEFSGSAGRQAERLRAGLEKAVRGAFEGGAGDGPARRRLGPDFAFGRDRDAWKLDSASLGRALREDAKGLSGLLLGADERGGILGGVAQALREAHGALGIVLESRGLSLVDLEA